MTSISFFPSCLVIFECHFAVDSLHSLGKRSVISFLQVARWNRYWIGLTGSCLVYFLPKYRTFGGHERESVRIINLQIVVLDIS